MRESFIFYASYYDAISELPPEEQGQIYKAIIDYGIAKKAPSSLTPAGRMCFKLIKPTVDAALSRYDANVENGKKGGRPKTQTKPKQNPNETQTKPTVNPAKSQTATQTEPSQNLDIDMDTKLVKENKNINNYQDGRVRERTIAEREPFVNQFAEFFEYAQLERFVEPAYEVIDVMLEFLEYAKERGFTFKSKFYEEQDLRAIFSGLANEKFSKIVEQLVFNQSIQNRTYYILGCLLN